MGEDCDIPYTTSLEMLGNKKSPLIEGLFKYLITVLNV